MKNFQRNKKSEKFNLRQQNQKQVKKTNVKDLLSNAETTVVKTRIREQGF